MRILFSRPAQTLYTTRVDAPFLMSVPLKSGSDISTHVAGYAMTGNKGNMIHRMAMLQLLEYDRARSVQCNLGQLHNAGYSLNYIKGFVRENFDKVVVTFSNIIRSGISDGALTPILDAIDVPLVAVGVGLQERLKDGVNSLQKDTVNLLSLLNERAQIFGVRGQATRDWCHENGFKSAVAIGCPSMFVYPRSIYSIESLQFREDLRVMAAGHLHPKLLKGRKSRIMGLMANLPLNNSSYVFQSELPEFSKILNEPGIYSEPRSEIKADFLNEFLKIEFGIEQGFSKYYCFNEPSAWRQAASAHDVYVGDRIHGGVAAMQAGVPALVLHEDLRVKELTSFHGIPNTTVSNFTEMGLKASVDKFLNEDAIKTFKKRYAVTLKNFGTELGKADLKLVNNSDAHAVLMDSKKLD